MNSPNASEIAAHFDVPNQVDDESQIVDVIPRKNKNGKVIGGLIVLSCGTEVPYRKRPTPRRKKTGPASDLSLNAITRAALILDTKESYELFSSLSIGTDPITGGGPATYPRQLWSLMYVLQNAIATQRGTLQWLKLGMHLSVVIKHISSMRSEVSEGDRAIIDRWLKSPKKIPSHSHLSRFFRSLNKRGWDASAELNSQGIQLCLDLDRFNPNRPSQDMTNAIIGDGTVLRAACKTTDPVTMDFDGTQTHRRVDSFALFHTEAGNEIIYGAKGVAIWSPSPDRHGTICLGFDWVHATDPASEAKVSLDLTTKTHAILKKHGRLPSNYAYDRAAGEIDQRELNTRGMILTTRAKGDKLDPASESHFLKPKFIGTYTPHNGCTCTYRLFAIKKHLHLQVINDTGEDDYIPLEHSLRSVITKGHRYHYSDHCIPCQTQPDQTHKVSIPWNGWKSFNTPGKNRLNPVEEEQYKQILLYLQPHAPGTCEFKEAFGIRERTETMHSILDALLPFKILQRWGEEGKSGFIYGFLMGHNIVSRLALLGGHEELLHPDA